MANIDMFDNNENESKSILSKDNVVSNVGGKTSSANTASDTKSVANDNKNEKTSSANTASATNAATPAVGTPITTLNSINPNLPVFSEKCFDLKGWEFSIDEGDYTLNDLIKMSNGKDFKLSQVDVPIGYKVVLYDQDKFKGKTLNMMKSQCLIYNKWENKTKSIQIYQVPVFYQACNQKGWALALDVGSYSLAKLREIRNQSATPGDFSNNLSYISVPYGFKITLYSKDDFMGDSVEIMYDTCLKDFDFDKTCNSLIIEKLPVLYEVCEYAGFALTLPVGKYKLDNLRYLAKKNGINKDVKAKIMSLRVPKGYKVVLWETEVLQGRKVETVDSIPCLDKYNFGNTTQSVEVIKLYKD